MSARTSVARRRTVADARRRRETPYQAEHERSTRRAWDAKSRAPRDLRHAVRLVRAAWINETPVNLTEGPDSVGPDGNPRLTPEATRFIFDGPDQVEPGEPGDPLRFRVTPFRATLAAFERGGQKAQHQAAIVRRVTSGEQLPGSAAMGEGVPEWCAKDVAETALLAFLSSMSDVVVAEAAPR